MMTPDRVPMNAAREFGQRLLRTLDVPEQVACDVMEVLVDAQARGFGSHGLIRLQRIVTGIRSGVHQPHATPSWEAPSPVLLKVDGHQQLGPHVALQVTRKLIDIAGSPLGLALASVQGLTHFGIGGYYTDLIAREGLLGLVLCNTQPAAAPFGGAGKVLGTNPISFSCRHPDGRLLSLDMATTAAARGRLLAHELDGTPLPDYVAADADGNMTNDAKAGLAGALLPLGGPFGYKGTGLAFMVDVLSGALSGANTGTRVTGTVNTSAANTAGYFFLAINPDQLIGRAAFEAQVGALCADLHAAGDEVMLPGEREHQRAATAHEHGLELSENLRQQLNALGEECGIDERF